MTIRTFVKNLQLSDVGAIYWANFSMQVAVGILDIGHGRNIFREAAHSAWYKENLKEIERTGKGDVSFIALKALIMVTSSNKDAIHNCGPDGSIDEIPLRCSNVTTGKSFYSFCLSVAAQDAIRDIVIDTTSRDLSSIDVVPHDYIAHMFEAGYVDIDMIKKSFPAVGDFLAPTINIKTCYDRFWLGSDPRDNPGEATDINKRLALGCHDGEFLVRLSFEKDKLLTALSEKGLRLPRRPSAFCVNSTDDSRFRGRRAMETSDRSTHSSYGQTVHLTGDPTPSDGLREWICESVTLDSSDVKVEFLGCIKGAANIPDKKQFLEYLNDHRGASTELDQLIIDKLAE